MSTEEEFDVLSAKAGETVEVSAVITTPSVNGRHTAVFRLADDERLPFGPRLWCDVIVSDAPLRAREEKAAVTPPSVDAAAPSVAASVAPAPASASASVESAASAAPVAPSAVESQLPPSVPSEAAVHKYEVQLQALANMGFKNRELNVCLLEHNNGNVQRVCEFLLTTLYS